MTKPCSTCKREFPLTAEFFCRKSDTKTGFNAQCKTCSRESHKRWKEKNRKRNRVLLNEAQKRWKKKNPHKRNVSQLVYTAVKTGKLKRKPCAVCDNPKVHAHHFNYDKPLEVIWLCNKHHKEVHTCQNQ